MPPEQDVQPAESGALSLDQFVDVLDAPADTQEDEQEQVEQAEQVEAEASADEEVDDDELEAADDEEADEDEEQEEEKLPPPQSWSKEDHAAWNDLPAAAQKVFAKREADRDRAVAMATQKASEADKRVTALVNDYQTAARSITNDVERAKAKWNQDWGNVDWVRHARENPNAYITDKAQAEEEWQQIAAYEQHQKKVQKDADDAAQLAHQAFLKEEAEKLTEKMPELMDQKEGPARRQKLAAYAFESYPSITPEVLSHASADELIILEKARRYDESQKLAKTQAALPRKNPTSSAKPVPQGTATGAASPKRDLQAASQRLTKTGTIDAFVGLLDAEDAAKARKARRQ